MPERSRLVVSDRCNQKSEISVNSLIFLMFFLPVTVSTSVPFDGLLVTGLYTSTPVQSAPIPAPAAFGFGESSSTVFNMFFFSS